MSTWQNVDAGPRQVKDLNKAAYDLRAEGQTHDEISGVTGVSEHRTSYLSMMGPVRAEVAALAAAIGDRHGWKVTRAAVRDIIAEYEAALPEARKSRPVEDNRRSPEEDAERNAAAAAREAEWQAGDEGTAVLRWAAGRLAAAAPAPGHPARAGAGYDCTCGECLARRAAVADGSREHPEVPRFGADERDDDPAGEVPF